MKVIFIKDLRGQGKVNDIKEVADGYATNYLINRGYAVKYTKGSLERLDADIEENKIKEDKLITTAKQIKTKLEQDEVVFVLNSGKNGKTFGSVSNKQIAEQLTIKGYNIDKKKIVISLPIASVGTHMVDIHLHKDVTAQLKVVIKQK